MDSQNYWGTSSRIKSPGFISNNIARKDVITQSYSNKFFGGQRGLDSVRQILKILVITAKKYGSHSRSGS